MHNASHHELRNAFHALLAGHSCYTAVSVFDPLSARMAADLGFEVGILGGSVTSYFAAIEATYERMCVQRGIKGEERRNASQLTTHFSDAGTYLAWASQYMNVTG